MKINNTSTRPSDGNVITLSRRDFYLTMTILALAVGIFFGHVIWGMRSDGNAQTTATNTSAKELKIDRYDVPVDGFPATGPEDAPIVIVEFSDYQCPFCKKWHDEVYTKLLAAYPDKIKFVYRNLPLTSIHPEAFPAAMAALCAGEQNAFWQFHGRLFSGETLSNRIYIQFAEELGLDMVSFESCIANRKYRAIVQEDIDFSVSLGIRSTPTFFINGIAVVGAQPLDAFKQLIDAELAGELPTN